MDTAVSGFVKPERCQVLKTQSTSRSITRVSAVLPDHLAVNHHLMDCPGGLNRISKVALSLIVAGSKTTRSAKFPGFRIPCL